MLVNSKGILPNNEEALIGKKGVLLINKKVRLNNKGILPNRKEVLFDGEAVLPSFSLRQNRRGSVFVFSARGLGHHQGNIHQAGRQS